ncbi:MAG TPA: exosortase/archaeosortase family protein [Chitinophagaceae bacterium]|nr:exosortase/archaeosortase family protein [Chitinophagaceae bacterium]
MDHRKKIIIYILKFIGAFCLLYFGTLLIIGLAVPGGYYSPFVQHNLDFVTALRNSLMYTSKWILSLFGYDCYIGGPTSLRLRGGRGINIGYDCLGYGVTSFWLAFVFANKGTFKKKLAWMVCGAIALWIINIIRLSLMLVSTNNNWSFPFGFDNHTWFNIVAYGFIFLMIWLYDKSQKKHHIQSNLVAGNATTTL